MACEHTCRDLLGYPDGQLAMTDPLEMNLLVAKGLPRLAHVDIGAYKQMADRWAIEVKQGLQDDERQFHEAPEQWKNDLHFFRLGYLCYYVDERLGIRYREDQRDAAAVFYVNPHDLFLSGVMDTRRGTCANMAALHVALGWRLRWPVSLAAVGSHLICRYDDGQVTHNIEATRTGGGGFHSHPDSYYLRAYGLPPKTVTCGSDLRALTPREMLGIFFGLRGRHFQDVGQHGLAEQDYLVARGLFPCSRYLHYVEVMASVQSAMDLFDVGERGHPVDLAEWLGQLVRSAPWGLRMEFHEKETNHANATDREFTYSEATRVPC
jgi:hypothetical protein